MVGTVEPLGRAYPIVKDDGTPTEYFIRWAQQKQLDIGDSIDEATLELYLAAHPLIAGTGIDLSPSGDISDDVTVSLADTAVTPGSYTSVNLTVDQQGRITAATNGAGGVAVDEEGVEILATASRLNFTGSVTVTDLGGGEVEINISGSGGGGVPTVVQYKSVAVANLSTGITLNAAPTNGNMLVAILLNATSTNPPPVGSGWTSARSNSLLPDSHVVYRFVGAGESATQNPTTDTVGGAIIMYEVNGALGVIAPIETLTVSTVAPASTTAANWDLFPSSVGLLIGWSGRRTDQAGTLSGSFTNEVTIQGAAGTVGGTGVSIIADTATKSPGASLPTATGTWPTSVDTKTGIIVVY